VQEQSSVPEDVKTLYERHRDKRTQPSIEEISKALQSVIAGYSRSFIAIDALDECQASDGGRKQLLSEIFNHQDKTGANLFATSQFIPEIKREFEGSLLLEIRASDEDVERYLDSYMSLLPSFVAYNFELQNEIKTEIIKAVNGMYVHFGLSIIELFKLTCCLGFSLKSFI
jgi:hypothetical protein